MKKRFISFLFALLLLCTLCPPITAQQTQEEDLPSMIYPGVANNYMNPYLIYTPEQFQALDRLCLNKEERCYARLMADIVFEDRFENGRRVSNYTPIGTTFCYPDTEKTVMFYLDGNGYMVAGKTLTIDGKKCTFNASGVWVA